MEKQSRENTRYQGWLTRMPILLVTLLLLSTSLLSGMYAKYSAAGQRGSSTARVARFVAGATQNTSNSLSIDATSGETSAEYMFSVFNNDGIHTSEVSQRYYVVLTVPSSLPSGVNITIDGISASISGLTYTFSDDNWKLPAGISTAKEHILTVSAGGAAENYSASGIKVEVYFEQIN